jgi:predicted Zn-dependent peptidase
MDAKIKKYALKNGIKVIVVPLKTKMTYISLSMLLGSYHEKKGEGNLTHYYEHLLARLSSDKYKDYKYIGNEITKRGGHSNAYVNNYELFVYIKGFYKDFEFYIDIISNSIKKFYIDPKIATNEKGAVMQELRNIISRENYEFDFLIFKYLYPKHYHLEDVKRDINYVKKYNIKLIRKFIRNKILTNNIVINAACPEHKIKKTMHIINKYFGVIKKTKKKSINYPVLSVKNNKFKIVQIKNKKNDDNTIINIYTYMNIKFLSKEHLIQNLLEKILFNFELGVFYKELRDRLGIIYSIKLHNNINVRNPIESYYNIVTKCSLKNVHMVINKIFDILNNYKITDDEILYAKTRTIADNEYGKFYALETYSGYHNTFSLFNVPYRSPKEILNVIRNIKNEEVIAYFEKFKKKIIKTGILFYYSNKNINKDIKSMIANKNNKIIK